MTARRTRISVVAVALASLSSPALGQEPWSERAVIDHVEQARLAGPLERPTLLELIARGEALFVARFTALDGAGRPMATQAIVPTKRKRPAPAAFQRLAGPDANACAGCHNQPVVGGAGDIVANAFVSEGFDNADFDSSDPQFSNERNTNHLMGAGLVELLAREMTAALHGIRREALRRARESGAPASLALEAKGVAFGRITARPDGILELDRIEGIDSDLVVRPFSQKGVMTSLRQFTINALNHHHGMQAAERFGARWTGEADFDEDGHADELTAGDVSALVAWQASRPPPRKIRPDDPAWAEAAARGSGLFDDLGCAACHVRALPLDSLLFEDPGPLDAAGTLRRGEAAASAAYDLALLDWAAALPRNAAGQVMVPLFGDLKRHKITDRQVATLGNELLSQRFVERDVFQTAELWGLASTAPYGHRGDLTTLDAVIRAHGGAARQSRDGYVALGEAERGAVVAFLKTLVIPE